MKRLTTPRDLIHDVDKLSSDPDALYEVHGITIEADGSVYDAVDNMVFHSVDEWAQARPEFNETWSKNTHYNWEE